MTDHTLARRVRHQPAPAPVSDRYWYNRRVLAWRQWQLARLTCDHAGMVLWQEYAVQCAAREEESREEEHPRAGTRPIRVYASSAH